MKKEALLYEKLDQKWVQCRLCAHRCRLAPSAYGICGVRQNQEGILYTLVYGEIVAAHVDPIEKKPFYHFLPGSRAFSIATVGCNFKCEFCQNWQISQTAKKDGVRTAGAVELTPAEVTAAARENRCASVSYTYTEPTIFFEFALEAAREAKAAGLYNNFVTNGYMTRECLETIRPYLDAANVDLKSFRDEFYRKHCRARLAPVLESIAAMKEMGIWVEVTTLVIPGENDSEEELDRIAAFLAETGKEIPWHVSRFHPDYRLGACPPTPLATLRRAREIGKSHDLRYVYLGNVGEGVDTLCYRCGKTVVKRGHLSADMSGLKNGRCAACGTKIEGIWG